MAPRSSSTTRRSTRQQSKEPEATPAEASTASSTTRNRGARHSRENSTEDALVVGAGARKQGARRQNLDTVPEQQTQEQAALNEQQDANVDADADAQLAAADNSRLSGVTAVETNLSEDEVSEIRGQGMKLVENLFQLASASTTVLSLITAPGQSSETLKGKLAEISKPGSLSNVVLTGDLLKVDAYTGDHPYILVHRVIPALLKGINPSSREDHNPDNIMFKINLASLAKTILPLTTQSPDLYKKLLATHEDFPHEFSAFSVAPPAHPTQRLPGNVLVTNPDFAMTLELRTQFVKQALRQRPTGSDPRPFFEEIWQSPDGNPNKEYWGISKDRTPNSQSTADRIKQVIERSEKFHASFGTQALSFAVNHSALEQEFPWQSFLEQLMVWISKIYVDLDTRISNVATPEATIKKLQEKLAPPPPPPPPPPSTKAGMKTLNSMIKKETNKGKATGKSPGKSRGRPKKGQAETTSAEEQQEPQEGQQPQLSQEPPAPADPNIDPTLQDPSNLQTLMKTATQAIAADASAAPDLVEERLQLLRDVDGAPAGRLSMLNPQAGATKHTFNDEMTQSNAGDSAEVITQNPLPSSGDVQPTQDTGYASQKSGAKRPAESSATGKASKRRRKNPGSEIPASTDDPADKDYEDNGEASNENENAAEKASKTKGSKDGKRGGKNDHVQPAPSTYVPPSSDYRQVNQQAKTVQAVHGRKPQPKRRPWDLKETDALIDYIEQHGTSWSYIKAVDKEAKWLEERTQVDLKDKARNMKMDYLKSGVALPTNFEHIQLDRKATDKLSALGIDYTQTPRRAPRTRDVTTADE